MSNLSRLRNKGTRTTMRNVRNMRTYNSLRTEQPQLEKTFLEYLLKNGNVMIVGNREQLLYNEDIQENGLVKNKVFKDILCDKVGLFYCLKNKQYMTVALNANYECLILHKDKDINKMPKTETLIKLEDIELTTKFHIMENANRLMCSVYKLVHDLTMNPILVYNISEIFNKRMV